MKRNKALTVLMVLVAVIVILIIAGKALGAATAAAYPRIRAATRAYDMHGVADGSYEGKAFLFPVSVKVRVDVADGTIRSIDLIKHFTGQGKPAEAIIGNVIAEQSLGVDVISGASHSSLTILKAIQNALSKGKKR